MNRQEAINALVAAGKGEEVERIISEMVDRANAAYSTVREDSDLTDEAKARRIQEYYEDADRVITERLVALAQRVVRVDRDDAEMVFGTKGLVGDPATLAISRRDAADRVANVTSSTDLRDLLARATRSGDEVLARAVVEKAIQNHDPDTVNQFTADRPALEAATERLWKVEISGGPAKGLRYTVGLLGLRPTEVARR